MALRISWAAVCFGNPFLGATRSSVIGISCMCRNTGSWIYLPLPMEGNATDLSFFSSARARQFFTVLSSISSHLSEPQLGLLQWITYFAGRPKPAVKTAAEQRGWRVARTEESSNRDQDESNVFVKVKCLHQEQIYPTVPQLFSEMMTKLAFSKIICSRSATLLLQNELVHLDFLMSASMFPVQINSTNHFPQNMFKGQKCWNNIPEPVQSLRNATTVSSEGKRTGLLPVVGGDDRRVQISFMACYTNVLLCSSPLCHIPHDSDLHRVLCEGSSGKVLVRMSRTARQLF